MLAQDLLIIMRTILAVAIRVRELFKRALDRGRPDLARRVGQWVLARGDNRAIRLGMANLREDDISS